MFLKRHTNIYQLNGFIKNYPKAAIRNLGKRGQMKLRPPLLGLVLTLFNSEWISGTLEDFLFAWGLIDQFPVSGLLS